jgi:malate dehydrogenase
MNKKVTVVGAGFVGATCARRIVESDLADVVLVDIAEGLPQGKALDLMESAPVEGFKTKITGTNGYEETAGSDLAIITAGIPRKPGMSRDDLLKINADIVTGVVKNIVKYSPDTIIIVVTNPLDVMTYLAFKVSGLKSEKVIGMAGILDTARYRYFISEELNCVPYEVEAMVLGGHGDLMVPLPSHTKLKGTPISELIPKKRIDEIVERTKNGGAEIVGLLKTGSAYYAPSSSAVEMARCILRNENKVLPCSVYLEGQYGISGVYCGVPVMLSSEGVGEIVELELTEAEKAALKASSESVKKTIQKIEITV